MNENDSLHPFPHPARKMSKTPTAGVPKHRAVLLLPRMRKALKTIRTSPVSRRGSTHCWRRSDVGVQKLMRLSYLAIQLGRRLETHRGDGDDRTLVNDDNSFPVSLVISSPKGGVGRWRRTSRARHALFVLFTRHVSISIQTTTQFFVVFRLIPLFISSCPQCL